MWGFLGFPELARHAALDHFAEQRAMTKAARLAQPTVKWTDKIKWQPSLHIDAESYREWLKPHMLASMEECPAGSVYDPPKLVVPNTDWYYCHLILPKGEKLSTISGRKRGSVWFNDDVVIPAIRRERGQGNNDPVWMSMTPMEFFSLRPGTKLAKGHTVVAGLGMGHQLVGVTNKRNVTKVTLIERDRAVVDWVMPRIWDRLGPVSVEVRIGDARTILTKMRADVALVDIFYNYGGNSIYGVRNFGKVWFWGGA